MKRLKLGKIEKYTCVFVCVYICGTNTCPKRPDRRRIIGPKFRLPGEPGYGFTGVSDLLPPPGLLREGWSRQQPGFREHSCPGRRLVVSSWGFPALTASLGNQE